MDDDVEEFLLLSILAEQLASTPSFHKSLELQSRRLRQGKIRRAALHHPRQSAFAKLFNSGQDDALVTLCGFDHQTFASLHEMFKVEFEKYSPYSHDRRIQRRLPRKKAGRKHLLSSIHCLGLILAWTRTRGSYSVLQLIFGLTVNCLSLWLRYGRRLLLKILRDHPLAKVKMPTEDEIRDFEAAIAAKYPALKNCWGAMDGLKLRLER